MKGGGKMSESVLRPIRAFQETPRARLVAYGLALLCLGLATWWLWPQVRRAVRGWRAISDGVSVQKTLRGDLNLDDEFARVAFSEFARLSPEADLGQLHLHLVKPAMRDGWAEPAERPWLLAGLADMRPWRSTSYFASDIRISEAYADFLEQLRFELVKDEQQRRELETLRREFTQAFKETFNATRNVTAKSGRDRAKAQSRLQRLLVLRVKLNEAIAGLPKIGQVERAYLDFIAADGQTVVKNSSGLEMPTARVDLYPPFESWMSKRTINQLGRVRFGGLRIVAPKDTLAEDGLKEADALVDLEATDIAVFRLSRGWLHQELLSQFRASAGGTSLFGSDGSLGVIPVGLVFARGVTLSVRSTRGDVPAWRNLLAGPRDVMLELPGSLLSLPLRNSETNRDLRRSVQLERIDDVKLIGVICRWL